MKIRVLMGFNGYEAGQVFEDWPEGMCEALIQMGTIEAVKEDAPAVEPKPSPKPQVATSGKKRG
jgi:hypothetical protein